VYEVNLPEAPEIPDFMLDFIEADLALMDFPDGPATVTVENLCATDNVAEGILRAGEGCFEGGFSKVGETSSTLEMLTSKCLQSTTSSPSSRLY